MLYEIVHPFEITEKHLKMGITSEEASSYTGIYVYMQALDSFPHWDEVSAGITLGRKQRRSRAEAIVKGLSMSEDQANKYLTTTKDFYTDVQWVAAGSYRELPAVVEKTSKDDVRVGLYEVTHSPVIQCSPWYVTAEEPLKNPRYFVLPEPYEAIKKPNLQAVANSAKVFSPPLDTEKGSLWNDFLLMPTIKLEQKPNERLMYAASQVHELRHLCQIAGISDSENGKQDPWSRFGCELDSDLTALNATQKIEGADEVKKAWISARYTHTLTANPVYCLGPHLDAITQGKEPPTFEEVMDAQRFIRAHFAVPEMLADKWVAWTKSDNKALQAFTTFLYRKKIRGNLSKHPERIFTHLRKVVEEGRLKSNPLAQQMGERILDSVEYFCPSISKPKQKRRWFKADPS